MIQISFLVEYPQLIDQLSRITTVVILHANVSSIFEFWQPTSVTLELYKFQGVVSRRNVIRDTESRTQFPLPRKSATRS